MRWICLILGMMIAAPVTAAPTLVTEGSASDGLVTFTPRYSYDGFYTVELSRAFESAKVAMIGSWYNVRNGIRYDGGAYQPIIATPETGPVTSDVAGINYNPTATGFSFSFFNAGNIYGETPVIEGVDYYYWRPDPVDIYFTLGDPVDYRVTFTTYSSAVPEPATWAMMIVGFGMAGAMLRRGRVARTA